MAGVLIGVGALAVGVAIRTIPPDAGSSYLGSESCASCHRKTHASWASSLHTQMMRPVEADGVLSADFDRVGAGLRFAAEDAVWAIGGKWEQQFMGHDGESETLLPGVWLGLTETWSFTGWDGWEAPVPVKRCHGCHTVGLDTETGNFIEPNIGCESCHGPGSWHVRTWGLGGIHASADAQVCGQCHVRGRSTSGEFFFPVGYRPGASLDEFFVEGRPTPNQNSTTWWGNGHERKRHQEFTAWSQGGHARSLIHLVRDYDGRYGAVAEDCLRCHSSDYVLSGRRKPSVSEAQFGITCAACHNVHGDLDQLRLECSACHERGAFYHDRARNSAHVPCPPEAKVGCVDCHMPKIIKTGGGTPFHTHAPGFIPPHDTLVFGVTSGCSSGGCHGDAETQWLIDEYESFYGPLGRDGSTVRTGSPIANYGLQ